MCVDESIIKFKVRSSIKQYKPKKPIKRGYKFWILYNMSGFVKKNEIYQGIEEEINHKFAKYTLGARVVLQMTKKDWHKNKIIYSNSIDIRLNLEGTLACGTRRRDRKGLTNGMATDESLKRVLTWHDMEWSRENVCELLELFREKSILWDATERDYKNKRKKYDAWGEIAAQFDSDGGKV
ncbi:hypothetical protein JTB14_031604 [Gonioctena quinquepunctata]|nr:hypothetical protein JTB14_031604 [Gonioctena quinquepunctata]